MSKRRIGVVIGSRANYASIKSVLRALMQRDDVELLLFLGASAVLDRYGQVERLIEEDGFPIKEKFFILVEGENPQTMAMSTGLGMIELAGLFMNHRPDIVLTVGDRFETLATAATAVYMNIHLAHTMGGEVSGTIDESVRHAVTKLAHLHFPAHEAAARRIIGMGEDPRSVFITGCPRIDVVRDIIERHRREDDFDPETLWRWGVGGRFDIRKERFLLVAQHPVTTEYGSNRLHMRETLMALHALRMPTIMLWPNSDAGSDEISKEIRTFREHHKPDEWLHVFKNLPMEIYIRLMDMAACMIGNSSSALREGAIIGVPAVNIGTRQQGRERAENVIDVGYDRDQIIQAIQQQLKAGKYPANALYGDGRAGERIATILATVDLSRIPIQKRLYEPACEVV